jgi:hypothetical protein
MADNKKGNESTNIFDEWCSSEDTPQNNERSGGQLEGTVQERFEKLIGAEHTAATKFSRVTGLIKAGNVNSAKEELKAMLNGGVDKRYFGEVKNVLTLLSRHTKEVLILSIAAMIILHIFYASIFIVIINLLDILAKKVPALDYKSASGQPMLKELSVLLALGPVCAIEWARNKFPTVLKPVVPWLLAIPLSIVLSAVLMSIYDFLLVVALFLFHGEKLTLSSVSYSFFKFVHTDSLMKAPLLCFIRHFITSIAMTGSILLGYYGGLKKDSLLGLFVKKV